MPEDAVRYVVAGDLRESVSVRYERPQVSTLYKIFELFLKFHLLKKSKRMYFTLGTSGQFETSMN